MGKVLAHAVEGVPAFVANTEVIQLLYRPGKLEVFVCTCSGDASVVVAFTDPLGFRVLDERELTHYWPACSTQNGWLFQITANGWLATDTQTVPIAELFPHVQEYFIAGINECVAVITCHPPSFHPGQT